MCASQGSFLKVIAGTFINQMVVAMGGSATEMAGLDSSVLVAQYGETRKEFAKRFPIGGTARVEEGESEAAQAADRPNSRQLRLAKANSFKK